MLIEFVKYLSAEIIFFIFFVITIKKKRNKFKIPIIISSVLWLMLIYWFPPMHLYEVMKFKNVDNKKIELSPTQSEFLTAEFTKVSEEIAQNSEDNKKWFYYKLIMVGALVGGIIAKVLSNDDDVEFMNIIKRKFFTITVGLAFILSVIIDIQVKQNLLVTKQLGAWIAFHYEPIMKNSIIRGDTSKINQNNISLANNTNMVGWENFLRITQEDSIKINRKEWNELLTIAIDKHNGDIFPDINNFDSIIVLDKYHNYQINKKIKAADSNGLLNKKQRNKIINAIHHKWKTSNSTHTDLFYSIFHFPAFHILTWLLYAFFLLSFYHFIEKEITISLSLQKRIKIKYKSSLDFIIISVHLVILIFSILSRAQADNFEMQFSIFSHHLYISPIKSGLFNLGLASLFIIMPNILLYAIIRKNYLSTKP